jgi:hypothetical protein
MKEVNWDLDVGDCAGEDDAIAGPCPICGDRGWYEDGDGNQVPCANCEASHVD